jgi:hypothetical protein
MALPREGPPSIRYRVVPLLWAPQKEAHPKTLCGIYFDGDCRAASHGGAGCVDLLEKEDYAKENFSSGLIAFDVRSVAGFDSRSIHPKRAHIFREHRF